MLRNQKELEENWTVIGLCPPHWADGTDTIAVRGAFSLAPGGFVVGIEQSWHTIVVLGVSLNENQSSPPQRIEWNPHMEQSNS